jgi:hypothetical protein
MFEKITGGSTQIIQGLTCNIPPAPENYLIDGFDLPKKDQKWRRTELPAEWEEWREEEESNLQFDPTYVHDKIEAFKKQEWGRRLNGYWFFNNGQKIFITGKHYFYINYWKLDSGYAEYRDSDRKIFYFWQYCVEDSNCYGIVELTMRRQGKTYRGACEMYEELSKPPIKCSGGVQSKTRDDAAELFEEKLIEPWKDLPDFFKPESNSGTDPKKILSFRRDIVKGKKAKNVRQSEDEELRNFIDFKPAKEKAYDGKAKRRLFIDELGKTNPKEEADVYKRHSVLKPCCLRNGNIWGKMYNSTTVEELSEGGEQFQMIWDESDIDKRNGNGETESGLYRYFLSALEGTFYDEYGYPVVENPTPQQRKWLVEKYGEKAANGSRQFYQNRRTSLRDKPNALASEMRKFPWVADEAFIGDGDHCEFNALVLGQRLEELKLKEPVTIGDFEWTNGRDSRVKFVANPNGRWKVAWLPYKDDETNLVDLGPIITDPDGTRIQTFRPGNDKKFRAGEDPLDMGVGTVDNRVSSAALYVKRMFDIAEDSPESIYTEENCGGYEYKIGKVKWKTNIPIVEYIYRPDDPVESYEDTIKTIRFFGCSILPETNKPSLKIHLIKRGYGDFIKYRPKDTWTNDSGNQNTIGMASVEPVIQQYLLLIKSDVNNYGHLYPFKRLVQDLLKFRRAKIRIHDPTVGWGFTLMATLGEAKMTQPTVEIYDIFNVYKVNGNTTELVRR